MKKYSIYILSVLISLTLLYGKNALVFAQTVVKGLPVTTKVGNPTEGAPGGGILPGPTGFVYYCQGNTAWASTCSLGVAGCGPTSMAMVLSSFGVVKTPPEVDREWGFRVCGDVGSSMEDALGSSWLANLGFDKGPNIGQGSLNENLAKIFLEQGSLIIGSSHAFPCANCKPGTTTVDHIFVVDGIDVAAGTVSIRDPNNCSYADGNDENPAKVIHKINEFTWAYAYPIKKVR
ncbi:hypothetical protein HYW46_06825 [Candidatus Daviesbacteria bacterium]|nr:hypothetical protein [Candidatus Daviesbacteria bacterium]